MRGLNSTLPGKKEPRMEPSRGVGEVPFSEVVGDCMCSDFFQGIGDVRPGEKKAVFLTSR